MLKFLLQEICWRTEFSFCRLQLMIYEDEKLKNWPFFFSSLDAIYITKMPKILYIFI